MGIELMSICHGVSSDDGEDAAQETLKTCLIQETSDSTASPAYHSVPDEGHPAGLSDKEQPFLHNTIISGENSPAKKRKWDAVDGSERGNR